MARDLYEVLGVNRDADAAAITRAYRRESKRAHPDRKGGSEEAFHELSHAMRVLGDPETRRRYDETGCANDKKDLEALDKNAHTLISNVLAEVLSPNAGDITNVDVVGHIRKTIRESVQRAKSGKAMREKGRGRVAIVRRRVRAKAKGRQNLFEAILNAHLAEIDAADALSESAVEVAERALELLKDYGYDFDPQAPQAAFDTSAVFANMPRGLFGR